jgi:hypothetical protein
VRPRELDLAAAVAIDDVAPPARWQEVDRRIMPEFATVLAVDEPKMRDCTA